MRKLVGVASGIVWLLLVSCQTMNQDSESDQEKTSSVIESTFSDLASDEKAEEIAAPETDAILNSLMPDIQLNTLATPAPQRFDVQADELPLNQFLMGLVDGTSFNMIVDPGLVQPVTMHLKDVTINEVLTVLQQTNDIDVRKTGNIFYVGGSELRTAVYPLDYLNLKRNGLSRTQVSSGQIMNNQQGNQNGGQAPQGAGMPGAAGGAFGGGLGGGQNVTTINSSKIETESETDLWDEVETTLQAMVGKNNGSAVTVSPQTGSVIVTARPAVQRQVAEYLGLAQSNLSRQVILEAKILEVRLNDNFQAGVDWSAVQTAGDGSVIALGQLGQVIQSNSIGDDLNGVFNLLYETDPADGDPFTAAIDLLSEQGNVQVLSSPRVSTINNQKAVIKVGTDEFFVTNIQTVVAAGINAAATPNVVLTPFFSGIALDVMPQVSAKGDVILHVHPSVSEVVDQIKTIAIGEESLTLPLALSSVRESDSIVKARSGQVVVIGGLMQNQVIESESGTPVISSVPIIGNLFKQQRESVVKSELVILLKATVIESNNWNQQLNSTQSRFEQF